METIRLAFKNLSRQKRRSAMLAFAIAFGFLVVTAIDGLATGAVNNLADQITQMLGGNVIIQGVERLEPLEEGKKGTVINLVRDPSFIHSLLDKSGIRYRYVSQRTTANGSLIFNGKKTTSLVYGCNFTDEQHLVDSFVVDAGSLENITAPDTIILSRKTADSLKINIGEKLSFSTTTLTRQNTFGDFTVIAITKDSGIMGSFAAYVNQNTLNALLETPEGSYDTFSITLVNKNDQAKAAALMEQLIRDSGTPVTNRLQALAKNPKSPSTAINRQIKDADWKGTMYAVMSLDDAVPQIGQVLSIVNIVTTVILLVILLIVMVGISNTYRMVMYERIREIGTMRALGMTGKDTGNVFTYEALILSLIGAVTGFIVAIIGMSIFGLFTFHDETMSFFMHNGHFTYTINALSYLVKLLLMIVLTVLSVHGTAKKASEMSPAAALRTVK